MQGGERYYHGVYRYAYTRDSITLGKKKSKCQKIFGDQAFPPGTCNHVDTPFARTLDDLPQISRDDSGPCLKS